MPETKIEWADDTENAASGCSEARLPSGKMDPACVNCYARLQSARCGAMGMALYDGVAERTGNAARWSGVFRWERDMLQRKFDRMKGGHRVFLGSMTDLWHPDHDPALLVALAGEIRRLGQRQPKKRPIVITLTKRADRLLAWQREHFPEGLPAWVWPGVTAGCQEAADLRVPVLLQVRASGPRVVSVEPMTGPVDLARGLPRVAGPWQGTPPPTWAQVEWPEWVPAPVRQQLAEFWSELWGRGPRGYQASIRTAPYEDIPNFGARGRFHRVASRDQWVEGRYIHAWNNIGRVVLDDGTYECVSVGSLPSLLPTESTSGRISAVSWVIAGGESGPKARPSHPDWFRSLRDQCVSAGVPFFFKQVGEFLPTPDVSEGDAVVNGLHMTRVGKKVAGRLLDGRTWDEVPS